MEYFPSEPEFDMTDSGIRVAGTGLPRVRVAAQAGAARARGGWWPLWGRGRGWDRGVERHSTGATDPYLREAGPGTVQRRTRLRMDLSYGSGKTKDECGTEADARAISDSTQDWAGFKLRVLTQNLWALPVISKCLESRMHAFAKSLGGEWDVIALQEVWHARERDALRRAALLAGLRYSRYFEHGCGVPVLGPGSGGTGLLLLSRFPIAESLFRRFSASGQPYQITHSDYLGGKGVGLARLHTPAGLVDVYVSHLHADYSRARGPGKIDRYKAHRVAQAFEVAHFIRLTGRSPLVLLMTDLNAGPESLPYGMQRSVAGLGDAFLEARPGQAGHTCETADNVFSNGRDPSARIDFVLFKPLPPPLCVPQAVEPTWELRDCWVHKTYIPLEDAVGLVPRRATAVQRPSTTAITEPPPPSTTTSSSSPTTTNNRRNLSANDAGRRSTLERELSERLAEGSGRVGGGSGSSSIGSDVHGERRINISDHFGVAAEFMARDPAMENGYDDDEHANSADNAAGSHLGDSMTTRLERSDTNAGGGTFPQGPLLARALTEIDLGVEAAKRRRENHLYTARAFAVVWMAVVAGGAAMSSGQPSGYVGRAAAMLLGGFLCAAATALFLAYWFSSKEELQGLKEVYQTAKNYDRHLPMEEAFPDGGFDTSQLNSYMEQHFR